MQWQDDLAVLTDIQERRALPAKLIARRNQIATDKLKNRACSRPKFCGKAWYLAWLNHQRRIVIFARKGLAHFHRLCPVSGRMGQTPASVTACAITLT